MHVSLLCSVVSQPRLYQALVPGLFALTAPLAVQDQKISIVKTLVEAEKCLHDKNLQSLKPLEYDLVLRQNLKIAKLFIYLD